MNKSDHQGRKDQAINLENKMNWQGEKPGSISHRACRTRRPMGGYQEVVVETLEAGLTEGSIGTQGE